jgi:hypothetical protein
MANIFDSMPTSSAEPASNPAAPSPDEAPEPKQNIFDNLGKPPVQIQAAESLPPVSNFESSKVGRFIHGMAEPVIGAGQLAAHLTGIGPETMDRINRNREARYQAARRQAGIGKEDWDYSAGLGNVLSPMNFLPGAIVGRAAGPAATLAGNLGRGAVTGATMGAFNPVNDTSKDDFAEKKATQMGVGAIAGGATAPFAHITSEAISPQIEPGMRRLVAEGFEPTAAMVYGPHSTARRMEEAISKWPLVGGYIRGAEERALESANRIVANRALRPVGLEMPHNIPAGYDTAETIANELGYVYDDVHQHMTYQQDHAASNAWSSVAQLGREVLPDPQQARLEQIIDQQLINKPLNYVSPQHGAQIMDGDGIQNIHSVLAHLERGYRKSPNPDIQNLGELVGVLRNRFNDQLDRQNPNVLMPGTYLNNRPLPAGTTLNDVRRMADEGWAHYIRLRDATNSTASMARNGAFTPNTYAQAVRKGAATPGQMAHNRALDQQLAVDMKRFIPAAMADSGTPERAMWAALVGGGAMINPQMAAVGATIPALYSRPIQAALRRMALAQHGPVVHAAGRSLGNLGAGIGAEGALSSFDTSPQEFADGGGVADELTDFGREGLGALGRIPDDLKQYAKDLPKADTEDRPSLISRGMDAANYGINSLVEGVSGGRTSTPKILGALGLPTGELEERLHGFEARNRPLLQVGRDVGAAGLGSIGSGGPSAFAEGAPNTFAKSIEPGGLADKAAGAFERGAADAGNPYRLNAGLPGKGAPLTPEQEALLAKFRRPEPATADELSSLEPKAKTPPKAETPPEPVEKPAEPVEATTARGKTLVPSSDFGPGTAIRFVHPDSHLAQAYENELISGRELFDRTKQAVSGVKAIAEKLAAKASGRMSVLEFQEWANQRHNPFSNDPREARLKFSIQDAEDAGYVHAYTEGGQEIVELTPLGHKAIERFKKSGM